jgi:predicted SnoaL-like aldol condensation-catalyzing enzyme
MEKRIQSSLTGANVGLRPTAGRLGLKGAATAPADTNSYLQLANSLAQVAPEIGGSLRRLEEVRSGQAENLAGALSADVSLDDWMNKRKAVDEMLAGKMKEAGLSNAYLPAVQRNIEAGLGEKAAKEQYQAALLARSEEASELSTGGLTPQQIAAEEREKVYGQIRNGAVYMRESFNKVADSITAEFVANSTSARAKRTNDLNEQLLSDKGVELFASLKNAYTSEDGTEITNAKAKVHDFFASLPAQGISKEEARPFFVKRVVMPGVERAKSEKRFDEAFALLDAAESLEIAPGGVLLKNTEFSTLFDVVRTQLTEAEGRNADKVLRDRANAHQAMVLEASTGAGNFLSNFLERGNDPTEEQIMIGASLYEGDARSLFVSNVRNAVANKHSSFVENKQLLSQLRAAAMNPLAPDADKTFSTLLTSAYKELNPESIDEVVSLKKAASGAVAVAKRYAASTFSDASFGNITFPDKTVQKIPDAIKDNVKTFATEEYERLVAERLMGIVEKHGFQVLNDDSGSLVKGVVEDVEEHLKIVVNDFAIGEYNSMRLAEQKAAAEQARVAKERSRQRAIQFEHLQQRLDQLTDLPAEGAADMGGRIWGKTTTRQNFKYQHGKKTPEELWKLATDPETKRDARDDAKIRYLLHKARNGFEPDEIINKVTKEGMPVVASEISIHVPVFTDMKQLYKEWNNGQPAPDSIFRIIGDMLDPEGVFTAKVFFEAQREAIHRRNFNKY